MCPGHLSPVAERVAHRAGPHSASLTPGVRWGGGGWGFAAVQTETRACEIAAPAHPGSKDSGTEVEKVRMK